MEGLGTKDPSLLAYPARLSGILAYLKLAPKLGFDSKLIQ